MADATQHCCQMLVYSASYSVNERTAFA